MQVHGASALVTVGRVARAALFVTIAAAATVSFFACFAPAHRIPVEERGVEKCRGSKEDPHSIFDDLPSSPFVLAAVAHAVWALRKKRLGAGVFAGLLGVGGAVMAVLPGGLSEGLLRCSEPEHLWGLRLFETAWSVQLAASLALGGLELVALVLRPLRSRCSSALAARRGR